MRGGGAGGFLLSLPLLVSPCPLCPSRFGSFIKWSCCNSSLPLFPVGITLQMPLPAPGPLPTPRDFFQLLPCYTAERSLFDLTSDQHLFGLTSGLRAAD